MKKNIFYSKIVTFTVFFGLLLLKFCCCMRGTAVHFDGLFAVSFSGNFFPRLYKLVVSIAKLPELNNYNLVCLKRWH